MIASAWGSRSHSGRRVGHRYRANTLVAMKLDKILQLSNLQIACDALVLIRGEAVQTLPVVETPTPSIWGVA